MSKPGLVLVAALIAAGCQGQHSLRTDFVTDVWGEDSVRAVRLEAEGRVTEGSRVILWAPRSMPEPWLEALRDTLDSGLAALEALLSPARSWNRLGDRKVTYYLSPDTFISHGTGEGAIFISWWLVERGLAPYKHEAAHELLAPRPPYWSEEYADSAVAAEVDRNWPLWLTEGLPDYLAKRVASETGLAEGDVFDTGGPAEVDRVCQERRDDLAGIGDRYVPGRGRPPELFSDRRREVAPMFYACAHSFVKYLVDRFGLPAVVGLLPGRDALASLETMAGESAAVLRAAWRRRLDSASISR